LRILHAYCLTHDGVPRKLRRLHLISSAAYSA
jgi:hypothetical protein